MSKKRPIGFLLEDILLAANDIEQFSLGYSYDKFAKDRKTINAVVRGFEITGEAANRLPDDFKDANPHIDWFRIRGFRNRLVHDYIDVDLDVVWDIRTNDLPTLRKDIKQLFESLTD